MKETILWIGLGTMAAIFLLQRFVLFQQKTAQMSMQTQDDDGVYLFTSARCAVCAQMKKMHASSIEQGRIVVRDVMEHRPLAMHYKVMTVPTTLVVRSGSVVQVWHGVVLPAALSRWL